tara:strand:+ start:66 stop:242 length:177 start_codon:yes stop_codon:yes gene_type:complete
MSLPRLKQQTANYFLPNSPEDVVFQMNPRMNPSQFRKPEKFPRLPSINRLKQQRNTIA